MRHEETRTDGQFNVRFDINNGKGRTISYSAEIEFSVDPEDYGNGYYMGIRSDNEAFGFSAYDIRYDKDFNPAKKIPYIVNFYADRYDGKDGAWTLIGIRVHEAEFESEF